MHYQVNLRALLRFPSLPARSRTALQIGHGTLPRLLDGRMDLKLRHLLPLCQVLEIHPSHLLERGLPDWEGTRRIESRPPSGNVWGGPGKSHGVLENPAWS